MPPTSRRASAPESQGVRRNVASGLMGGLESLQPTANRSRRVGESALADELLRDLEVGGDEPVAVVGRDPLAQTPQGGDERRGRLERLSELEGLGGGDGLYREDARGVHDDPG